MPGGARADHGVEAEHGLVGVLRGETVHEVDFGADSHGGSGRGVGDFLDDVGGGTGAVRRIDHVHRTFGVHDDLHAGVCLAGPFDLFDGETLMHGAEPLPQDHLGIGVHGRVFGAAGGLERIP